MFPDYPPSDEARKHAGIEFILAEDWGARFANNVEALTALDESLAETHDIDAVLMLTELRGEASIRTLGSCAISLFARDIDAERTRFDAEFSGL